MTTRASSNKEESILSSSSSSSSRMTMMMMMMNTILLLIISLLLFFPSLSYGDVVMSEKIMELTRKSAVLSTIAYEIHPDLKLYPHLDFFTAEPDQAIVGFKDGYCFGVFRGTTMTYDDWMQNIEQGYHNVTILSEDDPTTTDNETEISGSVDATCEVRLGYWNAYSTQYRAAFEKDIRECSTNCTNMDECVVLTGHSQGGAVAAVAAIAVADLNPYVITFGQPPTIIPNCTLISTDRWYRYVNTKAALAYGVGIVYDPVPFTPGFGAVQYGHMIVLGDDNTGVAYIGLDVNENIGIPDANGVQAHNMVDANGTIYYPGYEDRINAIMAVYDHTNTNTSTTETDTSDSTSSTSRTRINFSNLTYPVRTSGYKPGTLCSKNIECMTNDCQRETDFSYARCFGTQCTTDDECAVLDDGDNTTATSLRCENGICLPKLGSCMECNEHSDCLYGVCSWNFRCSGPSGLADNECYCNINSDCTSGRCEGYYGSPRTCEAKMAIGTVCNEDSDCISNICSLSDVSWEYLCTEVDISTASVVYNEAKHYVSITGIIISLLIIAALAGGGYYIYHHMYYKPRFGYKEIPTNLVV